jgi:hypothetical protein
MAELKTKQTDDSVTKFLNTVADETKRKDSFEIVEIMKQVTGLQPKMWGTSIIGFGSYHYKYESGHEGEMCLIGFSPRKQNIALYIGVNNGNIPELLQKLGKYKTGKGCLYINKFTDINSDALKQIIKASFNEAKAKHS